jgi:hypothetical protein
MKKYLFFIVFFIIANIFILFANIPYILRFQITPVNTRYAIGHLFPIDYYLYLTAINQGKNGDWLFDHPYTSERNFSPSIIYIYYIVVGKIAKLFSLWPPIAYTLSKILSAEFYVISLYLLSNLLFGTKKGIIGAMLGLSWTILPASIMGEGIWFYFTPWWYSYNAFERLDQLPHHMFGSALFLLSVYFMFKFIRTLNKKYAFITMISVFILGIIFPPPLFVFFFGIPAILIYWLIVIFAKEKRLRLKTFSPIIYKYLFLIFFSAILSAAVIKAQELLGFPWNTWTPFELSRWNYGEPLFDMNVLKLFSTLFVFLFLSLIPVTRSKKPELIFILVWAVAPFILLPFANIILLPKIRVVQMVPFAPFCLLGAYFLFEVFPKPKRKILLLFTVVILLAVNIYIAASQYMIKINYYRSFPDNYFSNNILSAFSFMDNNIPKKSVVLSYEYIGIAIPSFTGSYTYFGQLSHTYDFFTKKANTIAFFSNVWDENSALKFLKKNNITYVYFGQYEKGIRKGELTYPFLNPVYRNDEVTLFKVI